MKPLKLCLLQPPIEDFYDTTIRLQPLGLCYLKAAVRRAFPELDIIVQDYHHDRGRATVPLPRELAYLRPYYAYPDRSPFAVFYQYYHFGAPVDTLADEVAAAAPDIIGLSAMCSPYFREALQCAQALKQRLTAPIIVGGAHASAAPETLLRHACVDFVIRGEGERPLVEWLRIWQAGGDYAQVPNLGWKRAGELIFNPIEPNYPLDELPPPDFADFPPSRYRFEGRPLCFLITSRGCPYRCSFCSVHHTFGATYRRRATEAVCAEIQQRYEAGYRVFDFEDDNLTCHLAEFKEFCRRLIEAFPRGDVQFLAMNGISYHNLDVEALTLMRRAGFTHLNLALVSAAAMTRQQTKRPHELAHYHTIVTAGAQLGFQMVAYQILGLPRETLAAMRDTLALNTRLPVLLGASMFYLTPQTPIAADFPPRTESDMFKARSTAMALETPACSRDDLFTLFVTTRLINFFKGLQFPTPTLPLWDALAIADAQGGQLALGATIFRHLWQERMLLAAVGNTLKPVPRFQADLFFSVWAQLDYICTQTNRHIVNS